MLLALRTRRVCCHRSFPRQTWLAALQSIVNQTHRVVRSSCAGIISINGPKPNGPKPSDFRRIGREATHWLHGGTHPLPRLGQSASGRT
jgi:hypothetical protein